jgi:hypothetical protein
MMITCSEAYLKLLSKSTKQVQHPVKKYNPSETGPTTCKKNSQKGIVIVDLLI